jgi:FkbM family methyltransferase
MNIIKKYIPANIVRMYKNLLYNVLDGYSTKSFSQEGEDLILKRYFATKRTGFYVDVGAHHPKRFSNTYLFYRMGWRGINIDPNPDAINLFNSYRPRDINLACGISDVEGELLYYMFNDPALNSFNHDFVKKIERDSDFYVVDKQFVKVFSLANILTKHMPLNTTIDFMSIDAEGYDLNVLKSNDWDSFRPNLLLVEELDFSLETSNIYKFVSQHDYSFLAKTINTLIYQNNLLKIPN